MEPSLTNADRAEWARLTAITRAYLWPGHPKRLSVLEQQEQWEEEEALRVERAEREAIENE